MDGEPDLDKARLMLLFLLQANYTRNLINSQDKRGYSMLPVNELYTMKVVILLHLYSCSTKHTFSWSVYTVLDTKSLELAFLDILVRNSAILNAMTIKEVSK